MAPALSPTRRWRRGEGWYSISRSERAARARSASGEVLDAVVLASRDDLRRDDEVVSGGFRVHNCSLDDLEQFVERGAVVGVGDADADGEPGNTVVDERCRELAADAVAHHSGTFGRRLREDHEEL